MIGTSFSHYRLIGELGRGGMGVVYKAEDSRLGRTVALKFLAESLVVSEAARQRFLREARAVAAVTHANVATLYDVAEHDGKLFIAMEYVAGTNLEELIATGPLEPSKVIEIVTQVACGLGCAHRAGVLHRDIKPANIVVTDRAEVKLLDFGIAHVAGGAAVTEVGTAVGTAAYMSPEQLRGDPIDARTDLWSLGVVLYELLSGERPFQGDYVSAVHYAILNAEPRPLAVRIEFGGGSFDEIVLRLLAKDPAERYESADDLVAALAALTAADGGDRVAGKATLAPGGAARKSDIARHESSGQAPDAGEPVGGKPSREHRLQTEERRLVTELHGHFLIPRSATADLDPEDFIELTGRLRKIWEEETRKHDGRAGPAIGASMRAYFGYPVASENDARRAVKCAMSIRDAAGRIVVANRGADAIQVGLQIGVHTGVAVVSEDETGLQVLGQVSSIAALASERATAGSVVVSDATKRLCEGYFAFREIGTTDELDSGGPTAMFEVVVESGARTRLDFVPDSDLSPLVGRDAELALLRRQWRQAAAGHGCTVFVSGEAGLGKSRLVDAFVREVADADQERRVAGGATHERSSPGYGDDVVAPKKTESGAPGTASGNTSGSAGFWHETLYCSSFNPGGVLHPFTDYLRKSIDAVGDSGGELDRLRVVAESGGLTGDDSLFLLADLLGLSMPAKYVRPSIAAAEQQRRTLVALMQLLVDRSSSAPGLLIVEDLHWADPSTLAWLDMLMVQAPTHSLMLLCTSRPEFRATPGGKPRTTEITLSRLEPGDLIAISAHRSRKALPPEIVTHIVEKTDGIPLFTEELTKMILESGILIDCGDRYEMSGKLKEDAIPSTLHGSLVARLDRLPREKPVAQIGAVLGREFSYDLLKAVAGEEDAPLTEMLENLVATELIYQRGFIPDATYIFKHALIQDAAYNTLLRSARIRLHEQVAALLATRGEAPEVVARHYTRAGNAEKAIPLWQKAGFAAMQRHANREAVQHLTEALSLIPSLADGPERDLVELSILNLLGPATNMTKGHWAPEGEQVLSRATELCERVDAQEPLVMALQSLISTYLVRGDYDKAFDAANRIQAIARETGSDEFAVIANTILSTACLFTGRLADSDRHANEVARLYDPARHGRFAVLGYGTLDVSARCYQNLAVHLLGDSDRALANAEAIYAEHRRAAYHFDFYMTSLYLGLQLLARREWQRAEQVLATYLVDGAEYGDPFALAIVTILHRLSLRTPEAEADFRSAKSVMDQIHAAGYGIGYSFMLGLYADGLIHFGDLGAAASALAEAYVHLDRSGREFWEAEIHRLHGDLVSRGVTVGTGDGPSARSACDHYRRAVEIARMQGARVLELRALASLANIDSARGGDVRAELRRCYDLFSHGGDMPDLERAADILAQDTY